jgi:predicted ATPase/serine phosphatase RsbU (regulator of sigma subunit)/tRNA A-37 threonylcarbamoyl transferase component Bud32
LLPIPGLRIERPIHESFRTIVYRATVHEDGSKVAVKCPRSEYPSASDLARFRNEFEVTRQISSQGVIRADRLGTLDSRLYLILPYFDGVPLSRLKGESLPLIDLLTLMLHIVRAVGEIHQAGVVHKDLSPTNILVDPGLSSVRIIDFDIASRLQREQQEAVAPSALEGTLRYISPEQTGRMNRAVDYRADFYSLGAIFYELLAGAPVFECEDATELVHHHIAKRPFFPLQVRQRVPGPIREVVLKLLVKTPEERYQSAAGIERDLKRCLDELRSTGDIVPFSLGEEDASDRFVVAQRLYGREVESETMLETFAEVSAGQKRILLISGASGVGKSSLVREVHRSIAEKNGFLASGRADQLRHNIPYAALSQAVREVARQIISEGENARIRWQQKIAEAVGPSARVLADIMPELAAITGPLPPVPRLEPQESQNRLREAFRRLIGLLANGDHPLVLFLDDLQWVDSAALTLLRALLLDHTVTHLLFIGVYRDNEVGPGHPVNLLLEQLREAGSAPVHLPLGPLTAEAVGELITDTLRSHAAEVRPLAQLVHQRTGGNAFFVSEYLEYLHREGLISFQRNRGAWSWDLATIRERGVSDSLVDLVRARIRQTPAETRRALQIGACIGARFDLPTLSVLMKTGPDLLGEVMVAAVREGIVTLLGASYQLLESGSSGPERAVTFCFVHDRVRQAAYELLDPDEQRQLHLQISRVLRGPGDEPPEGRLYQVVDHLNNAWPLITHLDERRLAWRLNLKAARLAKLNAAYDVALRCLRVAMAELPADAWKREYRLTRDLHLERAECEYLGGDRNKVEEVIASALAQISEPVDRAPFYAVAIPLKTNQGQPRQAIALGAEALAQLGLDLPIDPKDEMVTQAIVETRRRLEGVGRESLLELPRLEDPEKLAVMRLFNRLGPPTYFTDPGLYALMHCQVVAVSLTHGHASESVRGYSVYGMILATHDQQYEEARLYGELAIELADRLNSVHMKGVSRVLCACFISHWSRDSEQALTQMEDAYRYLREAGDIVLASFALCFRAVILFIQGAPLHRVETAAAEALGYLREVRYRDLSAFMDSVRQVVKALQGGTASPTSLDDEQYGEAAARQTMQAFNIKTPLHHYLVAKLQLHYWFGELDQAAEQLGPSQQLVPLSWGALLISEHVFYSGLLALNLCGREALPPAVRAEHRRNATLAQDQLRTWAVSAPGNFMAKHLLLEAEAARVDGQNERALELYDGALEVARERQNLQMEAMTAELAGKFHLKLARRLIAGAYLKHAVYSYTRWGASAKAAELQRRYPSLLGGAGAVVVGNSGPGSSVRESDSGSGPLENLDVAAITKATHAIAEEIVLDKLVTKFMRILVENAGAELGCLIFPRETGMQILVRAQVDDAAGATLVDEPLAESDEVVPTIVELVARSERHVLYEDAARAAELMRDKVARVRLPRSVLCFPVMHLGRLSCIVYLENNLAPAVFTAKHVEVLRMLSAQAAISIENAHLYSGLQEKIAELEKAQLLAAERERLKKEMEIAERIQTGILPRALEVPRFEIAASMLPASEVGGDYYDVIPTSSGCWIGIGDVAGHGLESGLSMLMIQSGVAALVRQSPEAPPHQLLQVLNQMMFENIRQRLRRDDHATMMLLRCEDGGRVWYAGAHEDIYVCRAADGRCEAIQTRGTWLGALSDLPASMDTASFDLLPGDLMLLYTDGVIEARNGAREQFGSARLQAELARMRDRPAEAIRDHLSKVLARFAPKLDDDVTLMVVRYRGD